ncbi:MAG: V-type ATP synthase subunit E [Lachnospiraceae bacterium]
MTLEEKIEHLHVSSMEEARSEGNDIIATHQKALEQIFKEHKESALRQATLSIKTQTNDAKQQLNKAMAKSQTELKRAQGKCQTILKNRLFSSVRTLLYDFMKTPEYDKLLVAYINKAKAFAGNESMIIYINPSDESKKQELELQTGVTLTISSKEFMGGVRAVIQERQILIDHSFSSAVKSEYEKFLFTGGDENE